MEREGRIRRLLGAVDGALGVLAEAGGDGGESLQILSQQQSKPYRDQHQIRVQRCRTAKKAFRKTSNLQRAYRHWSC